MVCFFVPDENFFNPWWTALLLRLFFYGHFIYGRNDTIYILQDIVDFA